MPTLLIVDDSRVPLIAAHDAFEGEGWRVLSTTNPVEAIALLVEHAPDVVLLDVFMPGHVCQETARGMLDARKERGLDTLLLFHSSLSASELESLVGHVGFDGGVRKAKRTAAEFVAAVTGDDLGIAPESLQACKDLWRLLGKPAGPRKIWIAALAGLGSDDRRKVVEIVKVDVARPTAERGLFSLLVEVQLVSDGDLT